MAIAVVGEIGPRCMNRVLAFARNSPLPLSSYNAAVSLMRDALEDTFSLPPALGDWVVLDGRFKLDFKHPLTRLLPVIRRCTWNGWFQPFGLSLIRFAEIQASYRARPLRRTFGRPPY